MHSSITQSARLYGYADAPASAGRQSEVATSIVRELKRLLTREEALTNVLIAARLLPLTGLRRLAARRPDPRWLSRTFLYEQLGSSLTETAVLLPVLVLLLVGAVDYGRGFFAAIEVSSAAESGAMYGTSNPTDNAGIVSMAQLDAKDVSGLSVNASYGCECADGTGVVVSCATSLVCSNNVVRYVDVSTSANYSPILPYPLIPSSFTLKGHSRVRMSPN